MCAHEMLFLWASGFTCTQCNADVQPVVDGWVPVHSYARICSDGLTRRCNRYGTLVRTRQWQQMRGSWCLGATTDPEIAAHWADHAKAHGLFRVVEVVEYGNGDGVESTMEEIARWESFAY